MRRNPKITPALLDFGFPKSTAKKSPLLVTYGNPRILVVDDDPSFGRILAQHARLGGVALAFFRSFDEIRGKLGRWRFDAAVVDSDLGEATGVQVARYLERFLLDVPILLVSQSDLTVPPKEQWPASVREFLFKKVGHRAILDAVVRISGKREGMNHADPN